MWYVTYRYVGTFAGTDTGNSMGWDGAQVVMYRRVQARGALGPDSSEPLAANQHGPLEIYPPPQISGIFTYCACSEAETLKCTQQIEDAATDVQDTPTHRWSTGTAAVAPSGYGLRQRRGKKK